MPETDDDRPTNRLANESSAYLRQHMHNPVDWHPWGSEALERARSENKPLLVSIGYSACHWCHVMERESFEDPATAALMNTHFVNIKVDREERPDVDQIYMDTVTGLTGHGGWPLTVFCTPDGSPFYGGTYYPPEPRHGMPSFRQLLEGIHDAYTQRRGEVDQSAAQISEALDQARTDLGSQMPDAKTAGSAAMRLLQNADSEHGGFGGAPKFPTPTSLALLLAAIDVLPERKAREALDHVVLSCKRMARGGVYDQLGGGFHRYSVDAHWGVPHFEKMLYDQGQLLAIYAEAWRRSGQVDDDLLWPIRETVDYLRREMTSAEGGFHASQDADSEGEEGTFYVWTPAQVEAVLGAEAGAGFCEQYRVTTSGSFEGGSSVLHDGSERPRQERAAQREKLLLARSKRVPPATDTKRVTAWNALAASGLARAGSLLADESMVRDAAQVVDDVLANGSAGGPLRRLLGATGRGAPAFLDDLSGLLAASLDCYRAGAGDRFLPAAIGVADDIVERFFEESDGDLFLTPSDADPLVRRPRSDHDGATPHSAGLAVLGLLRVATLSGRADLRDVANRVIRTHAGMLERAPHALPTLTRAVLASECGISVAVVRGDPDSPDTLALADRARRVLSPEDAVVVAAPEATPPGLDPEWILGRDAIDGRATAFVCRGVHCSLPISSPSELTPLEIS